MSTLYLEEQAAPGTPASGKVVLYPKTDGLLYAKDDAGVETKVSGFSSGTSQATTSGTAINFTGIPAGVTIIVASLVGVSTNGTALLQFQLGDSGGLETGSYSSNAFGATNAALVGTTAAANTGGFVIHSANSANTTAWHGSMTFTLVDAATNTWAGHGVFHTSGATVACFSCAGTKSLSATLDRITLTTTGSDTFDAGTMNILYG